ncbi:MAG: hypothetical protein ICV84_23810 [Flavisolibacter sp.]|nr:hypothetical protein [Flavisolibacter sp.]
MKKAIFLSLIFSIYACSNQGNDRNESTGTLTGGGDTTNFVKDQPNNTGMDVSDTSTVIAHDTAARKPH